MSWADELKVGDKIWRPQVKSWRGVHKDPMLIAYDVTGVGPKTASIRSPAFPNERPSRNEIARRFYPTRKAAWQAAAAELEAIHEQAHADLVASAQALAKAKAYVRMEESVEQ